MRGAATLAGRMPRPETPGAAGGGTGGPGILSRAGAGGPSRKMSLRTHAGRVRRLLFCCRRLGREPRTEEREGKEVRKMLGTLNYLLAWLRVRCRDEKGQSLVEYGLIIALVALVVIGVLTGLGGKLKDLFNEIATTLGQRPAGP